MTKPKSKPKTATRSTVRKAAKTAPRKRPAPVSSKSAAEPNTKHDRIIAMLRSPAGATIAAIMTDTDGSSIPCAVFSPASSAESSDSTSFRSNRTRVAFTASRMARLHPLR
jgi:Protein of unknown function (DUF3489)